MPNYQTDPDKSLPSAWKTKETPSPASMPSIGVPGSTVEAEMPMQVVAQRGLACDMQNKMQAAKHLGYMCFSVNVLILGIRRWTPSWGF